MNKRMMKLLCALLAVLALTACRSGGGETTAPSDAPETLMPTVSLPEGEGVEDWDEPAQTDPVPTTEPAETTVPPETTEPTDETDPIVEDPPEESTTAPTEPVETTPAVKPTDPPAPPATNPPQSGGSDPASLSYEEYLAMTPAQQQAHYEQFPSLEAYIAWHNAALAEYEENQTSIEVTGGIDIGDFMNP